MRYNYTEIGERIRNMRKNSRKNQDDFIDEIKKYGVKIARNRYSLIENGVAEAFSLDVLLAICEIFECDIGFLLGEYKEKTQESHQICSTTGLTEKAIEKIVSWKNTDDFRRFWLKYISSIIESENSDNLLLYIGQILDFSKYEARFANRNDVNSAIDMIDLQTSRLWYASKIFTDIIEEMSREERMTEVAKNG